MENMIGKNRYVDRPIGPHDHSEMAIGCKHTWLAQVLYSALAIGFVHGN